MKENIIQNQITLFSFKAVNVQFKAEISNLVESTAQQSFDLNLSNLTIKDSPNHFAKVFKVNLNAFNQFGVDTIAVESIQIFVEFHTVFQCSEIVDEKFLSSEFCRISAPAIGFPFLRSFISNLSIQAGLPPIILPSINFVQFDLETSK